ncbi:TPA: haloacid dehalogenase-like hydrolase [Photobacterium damselae]
MTKTAYFDVCDTLYKCNTTFEFINFLSRNDCLKRSYIKLLRTLPFKIINFSLIKIFNFDLVKYLLIKTIKGKSRNFLIKQSEIFYQDFLQKKMIHEVHEVLIRYKSQGYKIILLSATLDIISLVIMRNLKIDGFISSKLNFIDDVCTGYLEQDLYGNKIGMIKGCVDFFVTDNKNDIDVVNISSDFIIVLKENDFSYWSERLNLDFNYILVK